MISPRLRMNVMDVCGTLSSALNLYTPYSYIAVAITLFALLTMSLQRSGRS